MNANQVSPPPSSAAGAPASATAHLPPVKVLWSTHNEDPRVELTLVGLLGARKVPEPADLRILCIAGCGTHALTFCSNRHVHSVDAVDIRPTQIMLAELTAAAAMALDSPVEFAALLGTGGSTNMRRSAYQHVIRPLLRPEAAKFWDDNIDTIEAGIMQCGGAERFLAEIRARLPTTDPKELQQQPEAVRKAVSEAYTLENALVHMPGVPAATWERIFPVLIESTVAGLNKHIASSKNGVPLNMLAHITLTGRYPMGDADHRPLFLQPDIFDSVKKLGCAPPRLRFHEGPVQEVAQRLVERQGQFDLVDVSNIFDLLPTLEQGEAIARTLAGCLKPGGALLCRWAAAKPSILPELFTKAGLVVDPKVDERLYAMETCYAMTDLCVGFKR